MQHKLQFTLQKVVIAWMFALVVVVYARVAIFELGLSAIGIAVMIGLYPFFGPIQPIFGRMTNRYPIFGYRRTPYLLLGFLLGGAIFPLLPPLLYRMQAGAAWAWLASFGLFFIFGTAIALMANTFLDLLADVTTEESRGGVTAAAWTGQTVAMALWAFVFGRVIGDFSAETLQRLFNLTPLIVVAVGLLSVIGLEKRLPPGAQPPATAVASTAGEINASLNLLRGNRMAQRFFMFVIAALMAVFLQDIIQEVMGGELFGLTVAEATVFQIIFNSSVAVGMSLAAVVGTVRLGEMRLIDGQEKPVLTPAAKKKIATFGGLGSMLGFSLIAVGVLNQSLPIVKWAIGFNGLAMGIFTFGAVTMMADMTVENQTGRYLGVWSLGQAIGLGASFIVGGLLYSLLIESGVLSAAAGYATIFALNGLVMAWCVWALQPSSVEQLRRQAAQAN